MVKNNRYYDEEEDRVDELQDRICAKVRTIRCTALLEKVDDFLKRVYRRGAR